VRITSGRLGGVVDDLVDGQQAEVDRHDLHHRPQPQHRGPDRHPGESFLGDGGVADPAGPELGEQPGGDLVGALEDADLLTDQEHVLVPLQLGAERVVQGLPVADHRHAGPPPVTGSPGSPR
jgi:hypothetical protein